MFCIVKIIEEKKSFLSSFKELFNNKLPVAEQINVMSAAPFYYLEISRKKCGKNFENLENILGRCSKYIIPCESDIIKSNSFVKTYTPVFFPQLILINSAQELIKRNSVDKKLSVCIVDFSAKFITCAEKFVNSASFIKIYTENIELYENMTQELYDKYGASVVLSTSRNIEYNCDFTVFVDNSCKIVKREGEKLVLMTGKSITLPSDIEKIRPSNTDKLLFASALYELCGAKRLSSLKYNDFNEIELH